jgi:cell division septation protein DedD
MEESVSWKGHGFTLFVFAGIVTLCSIFFVLGMLVGRVQAHHGPDASAETRPKHAARTEEETLQDVPDPPDQPNEQPKVAPPENLKQSSANTITFEIATVRLSKVADNMVRELRGKGFRALTIAPAAGDPMPVYRIQVGPYERAEADRIKRKLEDLKYTPVKKK